MLAIEAAAWHKRAAGTRRGRTGPAGKEMDEMTSSFPSLPAAALSPGISQAGTSRRAGSSVSAPPRRAGGAVPGVHAEGPPGPLCCGLVASRCAGLLRRPAAPGRGLMRGPLAALDQAGPAAPLATCVAACGAAAASRSAATRAGGLLPGVAPVASCWRWGWRAPTRGGLNVWRSRDGDRCVSQIFARGGYRGVGV